MIGVKLIGVKGADMEFSWRSHLAALGLATAAAGTLALVLACSPGGPQTRGPVTPPPSAASAPAELAKLRVKVSVDTSSLPNLWERADYVAAFKRAPRAALSRAGYTVVESDGEQDITVRFTVESFSSGGWRWSPHDVTASLVVRDGGNHVVARFDGSYASLGPDAGSTADHVAIDLINQMNASHKMAALGGSEPEARPASASSHPKRAKEKEKPFLTGSPQPTAYAVVIGVEKYAGDLPPPTGARDDAEEFAALARTSLGIAEDHLQIALDEQATRGTVERHIAWAAHSVPPGGRIYFFFSGHGAPDASAGTPYLVPSDGDPRYLDATAIALKDALAKLGASKAREVVAVVDACFSGAGGRSVLPPGARPLVKVREEKAPAQIALFSAASGSEISGPMPGGSGGLFTHYLVTGLGRGQADVDGDGQVSLDELSQWVRPRVAREAKKDNREQTPALTTGASLAPANVILAWGLPTK